MFYFARVKQELQLITKLSIYLIVNLKVGDPQKKLSTWGLVKNI